MTSPKFHHLDRQVGNLAKAGGAVGKPDASVATTASTPLHHHLDKRARELGTRGAGDLDDLLPTNDTAAWLGVSPQWLEIGRSRGYGPPFVRVSPRRVRYRRGAVLSWLSEREHHSTAEYAKEPSAA